MDTGGSRAPGYAVTTTAGYDAGAMGGSRMAGVPFAQGSRAELDPPRLQGYDEWVGAGSMSLEVKVEEEPVVLGASTASRSFGGCVTCRKSKVKCGEEKPSCSRCVRRATQCSYMARPVHPSGRVRRHHSRSTAGCSTCRTRRVKCDEQRPVCGPCVRRRCPCGFSDEPRETTISNVKVEENQPEATGVRKIEEESTGTKSPSTSLPATTGVGMGFVQQPSPASSSSVRRPALRHNEEFSGDFVPGINEPAPISQPPVRSYDVPYGSSQDRMPLSSLETIQPPSGFLPVNPGLVPGGWMHPYSTPTTASTSSTFMTPPDDMTTYFPTGPLQVQQESKLGGPHAQAQEQQQYYASVKAGPKLPNRHFLGKVLPSEIDPPGLQGHPVQWGQVSEQMPRPAIGGAKLAEQFGMPGLATKGTWTNYLEDVVTPSERMRNRMTENNARGTRTLATRPIEHQWQPNFAVTLNQEERHPSTHPIGSPQDVPDEDGKMIETVPRSYKELAIPYPSTVSVAHDGQVIQGRWERDQEGRIRPIVVESHIDSIAVVPHPAVPINSYPPAFTQLLELNPTFLGDSTLPRMLQQVQGEVMLVKELDPLSVYFPIDRDRIIYRHFIAETADTLIAMGNRKELNPWTRHFAKLALGVPPGMCAAQDAFRQALLSLSAYDLGYRITISAGMSREQVHLNPIVKLSEGFRQEAKTLLDSLVNIMPGPFGNSTDDLALAACLAMSHRDRIAACRDWMYSLEYAADLINKLGGAMTFLRLSHTMIRRFLMEQMTCVDVFASWFAIDAPLILEPHAAWWAEPYSHTAPPSLTEHVEVVFGLDKPMVDYLGRVLTTIAIGRHAAMRKAGIPSIRMAKYSEQEVEDGWQTYNRDCKELLAEADQIGLETKSRPYSARIAAGRILWVGAASIFLSHNAQNTKTSVSRVHQSVNLIFETVIEALGRGMVTYLGLPFCFAAYNAKGEDRKTVERILEMFEPYGRMDWSTLNRYIRFVWDLLDAPQQVVQLRNWRQLYDDADQFLPYI